MKPIRLLCALGLALVTVAELDAAEALTRREWLVDGVRREALVYVPPSAKSAATPVVFAFHGHGGTMGHAARTFGYHTLWPEALVVYPQGLPTPGRLTDPAGKKAGWQSRIGDQGDRDLKFFDALLAALQADYRVDEKRRYATGHSNGGSFTYLLWAARGGPVCGLGPVGGAGGPESGVAQTQARAACRRRKGCLGEIRLAAANHERPPQTQRLRRRQTVGEGLHRL